MHLHRFRASPRRGAAPFTGNWQAHQRCHKRAHCTYWTRTSVLPTPNPTHVCCAVSHTPFETVCSLCSSPQHTNHQVVVAATRPTQAGFSSSLDMPETHARKHCGPQHAKVPLAHSCTAHSQADSCTKPQQTNKQSIRHTRTTQLDAATPHVQACSLVEVSHTRQPDPI